MKIKETTFDQVKVMKIYQFFVKKAERLYGKRQYNKCIKYIMVAARWMYFFNIIYFDNQIENLIHSLSDSIFKDIDKYSPDKNCVVFLDSICTTRCLGVQYLSALKALGRKIIYIQHYNTNHSEEILNLLADYENKEICVIKPKESYVDSAIRIHSIIEKHRPYGIMLHMWAHDAVSLIAIDKIKSAYKYNIDLQDHTFWLGRSFIDFDIVFRDYGEKIALQKRELHESELIRLPYYPLLHLNSTFCGFPSDLPDDSIRVFTGGASYKMLGKNDIFFRILEIILGISEKVHVLIATDDSEIFKQKISKIKYNNRIHFIGMRKDIDQVFNHSDIYLSTYPFIGGLMSQYAAAFSLPILAYGEENEPNVTEGLVNHKFSAMKTHRTLEAFYKYAKNLILDSKFREIEGSRNRESMYSYKDFINGLKSVLTMNKTDIHWFHKEQPNYNAMIQFYLENENKYNHSALLYAIKILRLKALPIFYRNWYSILQLIYKEIKKKCFSLYNK